MSRRAGAALAATAITALLVLEVVPACLAAFGSRADNGGDRVSAAADFTPPQVTATAVGKSAGGAAGFVRQGGSYYVYANVAPDTGSPPSGTAAVRADASTLSASATAVPLGAGAYSAGGVAYGYRSEALTADAVAAEGPRTFTVTASDAAANAATAPGSVTVDNTPPRASDVQTADGGGTNGRAQQGDSLALSFSEPIEPASILSGWTGGPTPVVVRVYDNSVLLGLLGGDDAVQVFNAAGSAALPLGSIDLGRTDYVTGVLGGGYIQFGATGTASTMTMSGNTIAIVLGTYESGTPLLGANAATAGGSGTMSWVPGTTPYDRAANPLSAVAATESGGADRDF